MGTSVSVSAVTVRIRGGDSLNPDLSLAGTAASTEHFFCQRFGADAGSKNPCTEPFQFASGNFCIVPLFRALLASLAAGTT